MSHTCHDHGGPCAACAADEFDEKVETEALRRVKLCTVQIAEIAAALRCDADLVHDTLYTLAEGKITKEWGAE